MRIRTEISDEEEIVIRCREKDERIERLESAIRRLLENGNRREIVLYSSGSEYYIPFSEILYFESAGGKIYAHTARSVYSTDKKLFELEEELPSCFIKINQSCIANINMIERFDASFSGTLGVVFKNGYRDYVSRRNLKRVKERIGI